MIAIPGKDLADRLLETISAVGSKGLALWPLPVLLRRLRVEGLDGEAVLDALAELEHAGSVETWESPDGLAIILTPLEAERRGIALDDTGRRWRKGTPGGGRRPIRLARQVIPRAVDLGFDPDREAAPRDSLTILLGLSGPWPLTPWPDGTCSGCGGRELVRGVYCVACDKGEPLELPPPRKPAKKTRSTTGG
jgi:hypothetical protein